MGDLEQQLESNGPDEEREETEKLMEEMTMLDFDMLCSTVALQTRGKWSQLESHKTDEVGEGGIEEFGGVLRMWEGEILDCFDDRRVALESVCCPCYRYGKNMRRAGFGCCFIQEIVYVILFVTAFGNLFGYIITTRRCFLYLAVAFTVSLGAYMGFFRMQIKRKFNIMGSDSLLDDMIYHLICPCCTLCQESRTLEMNNVQNGTWHGRGDTICIGSYSERNKSFFELHPSLISTKSPDPYIMRKNTDDIDQSQVLTFSGHV